LPIHPSTLEFLAILINYISHALTPVAFYHTKIENKTRLTESLTKISQDIILVFNCDNHKN